MRYLIRYSEVGTKAVGTRRRFLRRLERNIRSAFERNDVSAKVSTTLARGYVETEDAAAQDMLTRMFGVQSVSPIESFASDSLDTIVERGKVFFADAVSGKKFAVRARRVGEHAFTSQDIERKLGAALFDVSGGVDLTNPEITAGVEVRDDSVSLFSLRLPGPGGLPLGSQERALVLLSGGFDSAVAAWEVMKRGVGADYVFFNLGGPIHEEGVFRVAKQLYDRWQYGDNASLIVVPFMEVVEEIRRTTEPSFWNLVLKRAMLSAAANIAERRRLLALVTGDAIGQVSSQTMANLYALGDSGLPVLRPLLSRDKDSIVMQARDIGTERLSAAVDEYCAIVPEHPVTRASRESLETEWAKVSTDALDRAVTDARTLNLGSLQITEESPLASVAREDIVEGATLIDVREPELYKQWHAKEATRLDIHDAMRKLDELPKEKPVLFVCEHGLLSAELAHMARERGLEAWSFNGGISAFRLAYEA